MSVFDWHEFACDPAIRQLGALLREWYGVWVGLLDRQGGVVAAGDEAVDQHRPICARLEVNALDVGGEGGESCLSSVQAWCDDAERLEDGERLRTRCHAGFRAVVEAIVREREFVGAVCVSGFVGDDEEGRLEELREAMGDAELVSGIEEGDFEAVPRLDEGDGELVEEVVGRIADRVRELLEDREVTPEEFLDGEPPRFEGMIGDTGRMRSLFEDIATIADTNSSVLVQGENGTGKELVARALHRRSRRANRRFVALNCAAIPSDLIESELFGHEEGAFSGAHRDREGLCVEADGGTLFLDEIGDMQRSLQSKLLRFLQDGEFTPVGSNEVRSVDVRLVCATNQDLDALVEAGQFRKDLYYRIRVIRLEVPPLRERRGDIPLLIDHFLSRAAHKHGRPRPELTDECRRRLLEYEWPGNVRELENEIDRLVIMGGGQDEIGEDLLSAHIDGERTLEVFPGVEDMTLPEAKERLERTMMREALEETDWNKTRAAEMLDVSRRTMIRRVSEFGLEPDEG
jgi:transcriptional regulator with PAS, ATPase and Fis domain